MRNIWFVTLRVIKQPHHPSLTATHIQKGRNNNNEKKLVSLKIHKLLRETQFYNAKHQNQITVVTPQCKMCGVKYRVSPCPLRSWQEAVQSASLCEKCRALQQLKQVCSLKRLIFLPLLFLKILSPIL